MNKDRLFLALPLDEEQHTILQQLLLSLQSKLSFQKWVHRDDLHLTLKFLGEVERSDLPSIESLIQKVADHSSSLELALEGLGSFGKPTSPSILWVGVEGNLTGLGTLQRQTEAAMQTIGFAPEDRPYSPHITLARKYMGKEAFSKADLLEIQNEWKSTAACWTADRIVLYRSHLGRKPMYEAVNSYSLNKTTKKPT